MKKILPFLLFFCMLSFNGLCQGEMPVDMYTGTPQVQIPIWTVTGHDLSDPISLSYNSGGLRLTEPNGQFGVSWDIRAGGYVSRTVRGLPDDFTGTGNDRRRGWLYLQYSSSTVYNNAEIATVSNSADSLASTCSDELTDFNTISTFASGYHNDPEPDLFHYNVGGFSGSFVFDNTSTPAIRLIPYQDIKIEPGFQSGSKLITGFTITTNTGVVYTLDGGASAVRKTIKLINESTVEFLKTDYELYAETAQHGEHVPYTTSWLLYKTTSPSGDELTYSYISESKTSIEPVKVYVKNNSGSGYSTIDVYNDSIATTYKHFNGVFIKSGTEVEMALILQREDGLVTSIEVRDIRKDPSQSVAPLVKRFDLSYLTTGTRNFIKEIKEISGTDSLPPYKFDYYNQYLPSAESKSQDFWGYYNGKANTHLAPTIYVYPALAPSEQFRIEPISGYGGTVHTLPGADRTVNEDLIQSGSLKTIAYPWGGLTTLFYEPHTYYDSVANQTFKGGGIRIQKVTYNDGLNPDVTIEKSFVYKDASNKSYGRLIRKPAFAFMTWEYRDPAGSGESPTLVDESGGWVNIDKIAVRTEQDLSDNAGSGIVGYKEVKVYRPGAGHVHYEYQMPAVYGFYNAGEWLATRNKFARGSGCPVMGFVSKGGINAFPFAPNPLLNYERGLVKRKREYDTLGNLVTESTSAYQYIYKTGTTPHKVWGLRFEKYANSDADIYFFGKYFLLTDAAKVLSAETTKTFDAANSAKNLSQTTEYFYSSANHKLVTGTKTTTADDVIYQRYIKYPLDYGTIPSGSDKASETIGTMQSTGRNGIPIETYQTIKRGSGDEKVTGGSIVKFNDFGTTGKVLPQYTLTWASATPKLLSQFTPSYVHATTKQFTADSAYQVTSTILGFGAYDRPTSATGRGRVPGITVLGYNATVPVLTTSDVTASQFAFSDFEETTPVSFTTTSTSTEPECQPNPQVCVYYGTGRTGAKSLGGVDMALSKTLDKNSNRYTCSGWAKHSGSTVTFHVKIQNTAKTVTYYNQDLSFVPSTASGTFEYFEWDIPIDPSLAAFFVEVTTVSGASYLDDVGFYPSHISLTTYTYTFPFGVNSVSTRHASSITEYDALGRVKYVKDKDGNILQKKTYHFNAN